MTADAVGGVWSYALTLASALSAHGVETALATMGPAPSAPQRRAAAAVAGLRLVHRPYRLEWMDAADRDVEAAGDWLLALEADFAPDVVHLNGYAHAALPWAAPTVVVGHSCVRSWWRAVKGCEAPPEWSAYATRVAHGLGAADAIVAPTASFAAALQRLYAPPVPPRVIRNGSAPQHFAPDFKLPFIMAAGRLWDEAKNLALLDGVAAQADWPVWIAGDETSPDGRTLRFRNARTLGKVDSDRMSGLLGAASIFVAPSRYEPFGLAVLEAALSGCALVLSGIPAFRELWSDAAIFFDPGKADELAGCLRRLTRDPAALRRLGRAALARGRTYTAERMAGAYLALYSELLATSARRRPARRRPRLSLVDQESRA